MTEIPIETWLFDLQNNNFAIVLMYLTYTPIAEVLGEY